MKAVVLLLFAAVLAAKLLLFPKLFDPEESKRLFKKREYTNTFIVPSLLGSEILSFDRKLFFARFLDSLSITNRVFLLRSDQWEEITRTSLKLDPNNINPLEIAAYQYMAPRREGDWTNFYKVDKLMHDYFSLAQQDWRLMMVMGYWWQFRLKNLKGAEPYAKAIYNNPEAALVARESYPILLSKMDEREKAAKFYSILMEHTDDEGERRWLLQQIQELRNEKK
ncbi:MAG: hypothetical protein GXO19_01570 [Epsilonproteobacteria bacterium]|nr:hypothetical protein [Campylobacterota bacterium]NPA56404.1 hypothetical protein [Campylobacterota bacterium]